jgi:hypothetical protein
MPGHTCFNAILQLKKESPSMTEQAFEKMPVSLRPSYITHCCMFFDGESGSF